MEKQTIHGMYVGLVEHLKGKTALLRPLERTRVLAQFDDTRATREPDLLASRPELIWALSLGYGWHEFAAADFVPSPNFCVAVQHSDAMVCRLCSLSWDVNDPSPPPCKREQHRALYSMGQWWDDLESANGN